MTESPLDFWHNCIGQHLVPGSAAANSSQLAVPMRTKKGVKSLRLGAIDAFYIASLHGSQIIGLLELPSTPELRQVPSETTSARKHIAQWLLRSAEPPFLLGVIGKASPIASLRISTVLSHCYFCEAGKGFTFDLGRVRAAHALFEPFPWKTVVAPAIHSYDRFRMNADPSPAEKKALLDRFAKNEGLRSAIVNAGVKSRSGEYTILSWSNIESAREVHDDQ